MAEKHDGHEIEERGWRQGSLLPEGTAVAPIAWVHPKRQTFKRARKEISRRTNDDGEVPKEPVTLADTRADRLLLLTQTCDIVKAPENFPLVEVGHTIWTSNGTIISNGLNFGSSAYYTLPVQRNEERLVLDFRWRGHIDKGFLLEAHPDNSVLDSWKRDEQETFARWLGRRYDRPALREEDVETISNPIRALWNDLESAEPGLATAFNEMFPEVRFRRLKDGTLELWLLARDASYDVATALEVLGRFRGALAAYHSIISTQHASYAGFSIAMHLDTEELDLLWASHEEGEPTGALPPA